MNITLQIRGHSPFFSRKRCAYGCRSVIHQVETETKLYYPGRCGLQQCMSKILCLYDCLCESSDDLYYVLYCYLQSYHFWLVQDQDFGIAHTTWPRLVIDSFVAFLANDDYLLLYDYIATGNEKDNCSFIMPQLICFSLHAVASLRKTGTRPSPARTKWIFALHYIDFLLLRRSFSVLPKLRGDVKI